MPLNAHDVSLIKGMLARGDRQSDIAAYFGGDVNSGRVSEINTGQASGAKWLHIKAADAADLPQPGPYQIGVRSALRARETLVAMRDLINDVLNEMDQWERKDE